MCYLPREKLDTNVCAPCFKPRISLVTSKLPDPVPSPTKYSHALSTTKTLKFSQLKRFVETKKFDVEFRDWKLKPKSCTTFRYQGHSELFPTTVLDVMYNVKQPEKTGTSIPKQKRFTNPIEKMDPGLYNVKHDLVLSRTPQTVWKKRLVHGNKLEGSYVPLPDRTQSWKFYEVLLSKRTMEIRAKYCHLK